MAINTREILQPILDRFESGCFIQEPIDPFDVETECCFQLIKPGEYREARVNIGNELFQDGKLAALVDFVGRAVQHAPMAMRQTYNGHEIMVTTDEVEPKHWNLEVSVCSNDDFTNRSFLFSWRFPKVSEAEAHGLQFAKNWIDNGKPDVSSTPP
jgi:hypothetical protein